MAINISSGSPLRHVATFNSSGTFLAPEGVNLAFVSVVGAGSGGYGAGENNHGAVGQAGGISAAYVQLVPGGNHIVTIGAGGSGGSPSRNTSIGNIGTGGTTSFDGRLSITGAGGNNGVNSASYNTSSGSGATTLTTLNPGAGTLVSTGNITSQTTGGSSAGTGGIANARYGGFPNSPGIFGNAGTAGVVHIYI